VLEKDTTSRLLEQFERDVFAQESYIYFDLLKRTSQAIALTSEFNFNIFIGSHRNLLNPSLPNELCYWSAMEEESPDCC